MLTELFLDTLLDQEFEGRHRAERVQNSEVPYVRCLIGRNEKKFDYINRVVKRFRFSVYKGTWTHSPPLVAMHLLDRSCVSIGFFLKMHATFPNRYFLQVIVLTFIIVCITVYDRSTTNFVTSADQ